MYVSVLVDVGDANASTIIFMFSVDIVEWKVMFKCDRFTNTLSHAPAHDREPEKQDIAINENIKIKEKDEWRTTSN